MEQYLGRVGSMLAASWDLNRHDPHGTRFLVTDPEGYKKQIQFNMIFRARGFIGVGCSYQRNGVVNTVGFNVPVRC